ncbi:MAG: hypothetical protein ABIJ57_09505 [Pseudomonadota bacterium]|uniref:Uncharacterized protein n=1 Tax=viral metagenome TaxID=1070528 RepID=A0A6M3J815_9ZZZZ
MELPENEEKAFQEWYAGHAQRLRLNPDPDDPQQFYDYRAAFKAGEGPGADNHWPSRYKSDDHPNLIVDGRNTKTGQLVGKYGRYKEQKNRRPE